MPYRIRVDNLNTITSGKAGWGIISKTLIKVMLMISSIFRGEYTVHQSYKPYVQNDIKWCFALILRQFPFGGAKTEGQALWRSISRSPDCNVTAACGPRSMRCGHDSRSNTFIYQTILFLRSLPPPDRPTATRQNKLFVPILYPLSSILLRPNDPRYTVLVKRFNSFVSFYNDTFCKF